jgi:hypothetical protein
MRACCPMPRRGLSPAKTGTLQVTQVTKDSVQLSATKDSYSPRHPSHHWDTSCNPAVLRQDRTRLLTHTHQCAAFCSSLVVPLPSS